MRLSNPLPKGQQTAYERWELASFDDTRNAVLAAEQAKLAEEKQAAAEVAMEERVQRLVAEKIAEYQEAARAEGYQAGLIEGRDLAKAEGRIVAAKEAESLHDVAQQFGGELAGANDLIAQNILDLAMDLSCAMVKSALEIRPELIIAIVRDAILHLPVVQQPARLFVHAEDAILLRDLMEQELKESGWRIVEDQQLERGGCRVETASNHIDASLPTRWQRLALSLGQQSDWLQR